MFHICHLGKKNIFIPLVVSNFFSRYFIIWDLLSSLHISMDIKPNLYRKKQYSKLLFIYILGHEISDGAKYDGPIISTTLEVDDCTETSVDDTQVNANTVYANVNVVVLICRQIRRYVTGRQEQNLRDTYHHVQRR